MRSLVAATLALLASAPAYAGGIGIIGTGGTHTEKVYFYNDTIDGVKQTDPNEFEQLVITQSLPNFGTGIEIVLGNRDEKLMGTFRGFWLRDAPQLDPALVTTAVDAKNVVGGFRDESKDIGVAQIGVSWGIVGDPGGFQFGMAAHMGSGFLTTDHTEFLTLDVGPTVMYRFARTMQIFGDVTYTLRYRKAPSHGANLTAGVRYLFD